METDVVGMHLSGKDIVQMDGKRKKNPTDEDAAAFNEMASSGQAAFNSTTFSPLKAGQFDLQNKFQGGSSTTLPSTRASSCVPSGGDKSEKASKKAKTWDHEVQVGKSSTSWAAKFSTASEQTKLMIEKAASLKATATTNKDLQEAVARTLEVQELRMPLLNAIVEAPSDRIRPHNLPK
jgi:hypothetical protein